MKFILTPMGSAGDVQPLVWVARLLAGAGHEVVMIAQAAVAYMPQRAGIRTISTGDEQEQNAILHHPDLWHPRKAFRLIASHMPVYARDTFSAIEAEMIPGQTVLLSGTLAFGARMAAERWNLPMVSVHLQPSMMMSVEDTPVMLAGGEWLVGMPRWFKRGMFSFVNGSIDRQMRPGLALVRKELGISSPMPKGVMRHWWHGPDGAICLFPGWYAPKPADWPAQAVVTRFPLYDEAAVLPADAEVEAFLAAGEKPVIVTPGSANTQAARFLKEAAGACAALGKRAILATRYPEQAPRDLPAGIWVFEYIPFSRIFPRAAAVIHHGGIGTTAQCLAAGVPQLIMPMAHDQPDNANRIKRFGVGDFLYPKKFVSAGIAGKLKGLLASAEVAGACGRYQEKMRQQMTGEEMVGLIEELSEKAVRGRKSVA